MSRTPGNDGTTDSLGVLADLIRDIEVAWHLLWDARVPTAVKLIPALALIYIVSPIDLIPDPILGLGQLDDLAVLLLGLKLFLSLSPESLVREYSRREKPQDKTDAPPDYVDAEYRVLHDDD